MRIDGTHGLEPYGLTDGKLPQVGTPRPAAAPKVSPIEPAAEAPQSAQLQAAKDAPEVNLQAVEDARKMLQSGLLDTPEAALRAAESMLTRGL